ncbi:MAG TPA: penicillin-binding protein 2, partial [Chloroflexia bacterium]|nr:penicillin-binding protein 2 [Chloroflexia bacterium]
MPQSQTLIRGWRIWAVLTAFLVGSIYIAVRLFQLQVLEQPVMAQKVAANITRTDLILPNRGTIRDSRGFLLAGDSQAADLYLDKAEKTNAQLHNIADLLAPTLGQTPEDLYRRIQSVTATTMLLARRMDTDAATRLRQLRSTWPEIRASISLDPQPRRDYPNGNFASHLLGFADYDNHGQYGIEQFYDEQLAGTPGYVTAERDSDMVPLPMDDPHQKPAMDGADLTLTIDNAVQFMAERELDNTLRETGAQKGMILITDPHTGAIIALATSPRFDPNHFTNVGEDDWGLFKNPAVSDVYEPGSTFKVLTMAAAIDGGAVHSETAFNCTGTIHVYGWPIHNSTSSAHGTETMREGLSRSCNIALDFAATALGETKYYEYVRAFGIGQPTGIDMAGEVDGLISFPGDEGYSAINLYTNAFGQGLSVTPVQLVTAIGAVANGGTLMKPYVVSSISRNGQVVQANKPTIVRRVIKPESAAEITDMMEWAVDHTDAGKVAKVPGYRTATKTGTAQIPGPNGAYDPNGTIASVAGFVPAYHPKFIMLVRLDRPQSSQWGGETASPAFGRLSAQLLQYWKVPPDEEK